MGLSVSRWCFALGLGVFFLTACSSRMLDIQFSAAPALNPDANHQSLPVLVKVFQLKSNQLFKQSSFRSLWQNAKPVLGRDLLAEQDIIVMPGERKTVSINYHPKANYIGFVAVFRKRGERGWKLIQSVPGMLFSNSINLHLVNDHLLLG